MNPWSNTLQGFILLNFLFLGLLDNLIRTDTMQMTPEELTEKLSRQHMVVGVHCGYNL